MTNDNTPPNTIYIAFGDTLYDGIKGTQSIRLWTSDAEQAALFEQETGAASHEYRLVGNEPSQGEQAAWHVRPEAA